MYNNRNLNKLIVYILVQKILAQKIWNLSNFGTLFSDKYIFMIYYF